MIKRICNKLVRDNYIQEIENMGGSCNWEYMDNSSYKKKLDEKLVEKINIYMSSSTLDSLVEIEEVIRAIADERGVSQVEFQRKRLDLLGEQGGYNNRILLKDAIF